MNLQVRHSSGYLAKVIGWNGALVDLDDQKLAETCGGLPGGFVCFPR
jgi:hypothetical protein